MNAKEAKQLTLQAKYNLLSEKESLWIDISEYIFNEIKKAASKELDEIILSLNHDIFKKLKNDDYNFIREKLEAEDYSIEYILERTPFGKREVKISW